LLKRATLAELKRGIFIKSDWGNVLPTWHIAAVAAAIQQLGSPIDIQVSSVDFLFPHLENVRAIAAALTGKPHANIWMLCEQMWSSKDTSETDQLQETIAIRELIANGYSGTELRYWLLSSHYCKPFHATLKSLGNAVQGYRRLHEFINRLRHARTHQEDHAELAELIFALEQSFFEALSDDLNMPKAFSALFKFIRQVNPILDAKAMSSAQSQQILESLKKLNGILGILDFEWKTLDREDEALLQRREQARSDKDWREADRLRFELQQRGIRLWDTPQGARWERLA